MPTRTEVPFVGMTLVEGKDKDGVVYEAELPGDGDAAIEQGIDDEMAGRTVEGPSDATEALQMLVRMTHPIPRGGFMVTFTAEVFERLQQLAKRRLSVDMPAEVPE